MHVVLAYLFGLAFIPNPLIRVEGCVPWENITTFLNTYWGQIILSHMHVVLAYLFGLAFVLNTFMYLEGCVPWEDITTFLNTLGRSSVARGSLCVTGLARLAQSGRMTKGSLHGTPIYSWGLDMLQMLNVPKP